MKNPKELKVVFIGRENEFNLGMIDWLVENYTLQASFFVELDRKTVLARLKRLAKRVKKYGVLKVFDETLFHFFYRMIYSKRDHLLINKYFPIRFREKRSPQGVFFRCSNIHAQNNIDSIASYKPDIIFSLCTNTIFKRELYTIPKYGMFVYHEGILPQYRGLHTIAWAIMNNDYKYIGYSLFKVNDTIDAGDLVCTNSFTDARKFGFQWSFIGHAALLQGLPEIKRTLDNLFINDRIYNTLDSANTNLPLYSWVPFSRYLRWKITSHYMSRYFLIKKILVTKSNKPG